MGLFLFSAKTTVSPTTFHSKRFTLIPTLFCSASTTCYTSLYSGASCALAGVDLHHPHF